MPASLARFLPGRNARRTGRAAPKLGLTALEDRVTPANLRILDIQMLDGTGNPVFTTAQGARMQFRTTYEITDLTTADKYYVNYALNGFTLESAELTGTGGQGVQQTVTLGGWYAVPGKATLTVTLDNRGQIAETAESDNSKTLSFTPLTPDAIPADPVSGDTFALPQKLIWPVDGVYGTDYAINRVVDVNPNKDVFADLQAGPFAKDANTGYSVRLANYAAMDQGVAVFAAADGVVESATDGLNDREIKTDAMGRNGNKVVLNHGNEWRSIYDHFQLNTVTVRAGDAVRAGQVIGYVGGSGNVDLPTLDFSVTYKQAFVETLYNPSGYFLDAVQYPGSRAVGVTDAGFTNYDPTTDLPERPTTVGTFGASGAQAVNFWFALSHAKAGDTVQAKFFDPAGAVAGTVSNTFVAANNGVTGVAQLAAPGAVGTWTGKVYMNGTEIAARTFAVETGPGRSQIRVFQEAGDKTVINSGRTTPVDFGSIAVGGTPPALEFNVENRGTAPLTLSNLRTPAGFSLVGTLPPALAAGATTKLKFQLDAAGVSPKYGSITIATTDPDTPDFTFTVRGTVTGSSPAGRPVLALNAAAASFRQNTSPVLVVPAATLTDPDSTSFVGGNVTAAIATGPARAGDTLAVRNEGIGAGQISVVGSAVAFGGADIGTFTGGTSGTPLIVALNGFSTPEAVQALIRNITFNNVVPGLTSDPRYIAVSAQDNTGNVTDRLIATVTAVTPPDLLSVGPVVPAVRTTPVDDVTIVFANAPDPATFTLADVTLTLNGGPNLLSAATPLTFASGTVWKLAGLAAVTAADGTYTLTVTLSTARTLLGTPGLGETAVTWSVDTVAPAVTIEQAPAQPDPTNTPPFVYTVTFSEVVTGFDAADIVITGSAGAGTTEVLPGGDGKTFTVRLLTATDPGTVIAAVRAGAGADAAGNKSGASTSLDNTITYELDPQNGAPTVTAIADQTVAFNSATGAIAFTVADDKTAAGSLIVRATSDNPLLVSQPAIVLFGSGGDRNIVITPTAGRSGTATITVQVEDETGLIGTETFLLTVTGAPANVAPTIGTIADATIAAGAAFGPVTFAVGDDVSVGAVTLSAVSGNTNLVPAANIAFGGSGAARTITVTPAAGQTGTATLVVTVTDAGGLTATETFTLTVTPAAGETAPTITAIADATVAAGGTVGPVPFVVTDAQTPGTSLIVTAASSNAALVPAANVVFGGAGVTRNLTVTPVAGQTGTATITVTVTDAAGLTATESFTLTVTPTGGPVDTSNRGLVGYRQYAVGSDAGLGTVTLYNADGSPRITFDPYPGFTGGVRTAAADFNGDGVADVLTGSGPGAQAQVAITDGATGIVLFTNAPFETSFTGGTFVSAGDFTGDGVPDIAITPDLGGGPRVRVYDGATRQQLVDFFGIDDPFFRGGARTSTGDVNGDGIADLIVAAGFDGGPRVAVYDGKSIAAGSPRRLNGDFFAFEQTLRNGVYVAAGDIDGDGFADVIVGGGPSGGPRVTAFSGKDLLENRYTQVANFFAGDTESRGGIRVSVKNLDGDTFADVVVGAGEGAGSRVTGYLGSALRLGVAAPALEFDALEGYTGGVFVG